MLVQNLRYMVDPLKFFIQVLSVHAEQLNEYSDIVMAEHTFFLFISSAWFFSMDFYHLLTVSTWSIILSAGRN